jgi:hypothetical protein
MMTTVREPRSVALALSVAALFTVCTARGEEKLRVYFVGNSVTDTINYQGLQNLAEGRGRTLIWGRDMIPGAGLSWLWEHPEDGFREEPFGLYPKALPAYTWDVLSLQPYDRHLDGEGGDLVMARNFIDLALKKSPDVQVYIYSRWSRKEDPKGGLPALDYQARWQRTYTDKDDGSRDSRDYFERLVGELRKVYKGRAKPVLLVPVGDVLLELDGRMRAGKVPGYADVDQLFVDGVHLNNVGSYAVGTSFYATLFRDNPGGMSAGPYNERLDPKKDRRIDEALAAAIQDAVWTVVGKHPLAGVAHRR